MSFVSTAAKGGGSLTQIAAQSLTGTAASFDFQSIPPTYRHLRIYLFGRVDVANIVQFCGVRFNNDSGSNYNTASVVNTSASAVGAQEQAPAQTTLQIIRAAGSTAAANSPGYVVIEITDYLNTTFFKGVQSYGMSQWGTASANRTIGIYAGIWLSTAAINRVTIDAGGGNWIAGSTCSLYGIA